MLNVSQLSVSYRTENGLFEAVKNLHFTLEKGEALGIVGQSGSGKTSVLLAILQLLDNNAIATGQIIFNPNDKSVDLLKISEREMQTIRGRQIGLVCQEPMSALNPVLRCGEQVAEVLRLHKKMGKKEAAATVLHLFQNVRLDEPERMFNSFPHQLSGGQKQRVMIAIALAAEPELLIFDEPTTALDRRTKSALLDLLADLKTSLGCSFLFISHDKKSVARIADRVLLMENGEQKAIGPTAEILRDDSPFLLKKLVPNNAFSIKTGPPILVAKNLSLHFPQPRRHFLEKKRTKTIFENLSFELARGQILGLVGESGKGKTSLGRIIAGLLEPSGGDLFLNGKKRGDDPENRRQIQLIFQDSHEALNPRRTIFQSLAEPLEQLFISKKEWPARIAESLESVGLTSELAHRFPHQISGGQRQRVNIARALLLNPALLICDEITASLDIEIQWQIMNLLSELVAENGLAIILISHDDEIIGHYCDQVIEL